MPRARLSDAPAVAPAPSQTASHWGLRQHPACCRQLCGARGLVPLLPGAAPQPALAPGTCQLPHQTPSCQGHFWADRGASSDSGPPLHFGVSWLKPRCTCPTCWGTGTAQFPDPEPPSGLRVLRGQEREGVGDACGLLRPLLAVSHHGPSLPRSALCTWACPGHAGKHSEPPFGMGPSPIQIPRKESVAGAAEP